MSGHAPGTSRDDGSSRMRRMGMVVAPVLVAAVFFGVRLAEGDDIIDPVEIASDAPRFARLADLVAASDAVVLAEVVATGPGRVLGAGASAVTTHLVELRVVDSVAGATPTTVVVEEPVALADGTPVAVDGVAPLLVGQRGVFFLLLGDGDVAPYAATVGPQGSYLVDGDRLVAPLDDTLAAALADGGGPALVDAVRRLAR